jgi:hypothetical protein
MFPYGNSPPFPLFLDVGIGVVDELTDESEGLASPISQFLNAPGYVL